MSALCRDGGLLPEDVELLGRNLTFQTPVKLQHAGLYECAFSYHHRQTTLRFNVTVRPTTPRLGENLSQVLPSIFPIAFETLTPGLFLSVPPTVWVDLRSERGHRVMECAAKDAVPAANVSWLLPEGVSEDFSSTPSNGSRSIRGVLLLPACLPRELTALTALTAQSSSVRDTGDQKHNTPCLWCVLQTSQ